MSRCCQIFLRNIADADTVAFVFGRELDLNRSYFVVSEFDSFSPKNLLFEPGFTSVPSTTS